MLNRSQSAILAAICLFTMAMIAPMANYYVVVKPVAANDAAKTLQNLITFEPDFRNGIAQFMAVAILDIIIAWALYIFFRPVNPKLALLAAWFRLAYAAVLVAALIFPVQALQAAALMTHLPEADTGILSAQTLLAIKTFQEGWSAGLAIFGIHLLLLGYMAWQAGFMRKILGPLLLITGAGYTIDGFGKVISANYHLNLVLFTFVGELVLIFWLLLEGRKLSE